MLCSRRTQELDRDADHRGEDATGEQMRHAVESSEPGRLEASGRRATAVRLFCMCVSIKARTHPQTNTHTHRHTNIILS